MSTVQEKYAPTLKEFAKAVSQIGISLKEAIKRLEEATPKTLSNE